MKKLIFLSSFLLLSYFSSNSQTVTKSGNNTVNDAVCPAISTTYTVSRPSGFTSCQINVVCLWWPNFWTKQPANGKCDLD